MILIVLMFLCALGLSGVAAFYSIAGLIAIFAAAPIPIAIMGSTLEASKLVIASWLYRNWGAAPGLMRTYLTASLVVLMALTSMGIFGYLSKAHTDQAVPTGEIAAKIKTLDDQIATEKEAIEAARKGLTQLDAQVNETIARTATASDDRGVARSIAIRKSQAKERQTLQQEIARGQQAIAQLNQQRAPIAAEYRKVEAEVGPIKYIAAVIYGDNPDQTVLERAVRWMIMMIVVVFDPLAVVMLIAANWSAVNRVRQVQPTPNQPEQPTDEPPEQVQGPFEPADIVAEQQPAETPPEPPAPPAEPRTPVTPPPRIEPEPEQLWRSRPPPRRRLGISS